jgi:hypothetical protein
MAMTPGQLRKACDRVGGVYAMARFIGKASTPQYLYRRLREEVAISAFDALAIRKALEMAEKARP